MVSLLVSFPAVPTEELVQGGVLLIFLVIPTSQCVVPDEGGFCTGNGINESEPPLPGIPHLPITTLIPVFSGFFPCMGVL